MSNYGIMITNGRMAWPIRKVWCYMALVFNLHVIINATFALDLSLMITASYLLYLQRKSKKRTKDKTAKSGKPTKDKKKT